MFTENELEKDPLKDVAAEPYELLDKTRYDFSSKQLPEEREAQLESIMSKLREECTIKGIMVITLSACFARGGNNMTLEPVQPSHDCQSMDETSDSECAETADYATF